MFRLTQSFLLVTSLASDMDVDALTACARQALAPFDPLTIHGSTTLKIKTNQSRLVLDAQDVVLEGFSDLEVISFKAPVPLISTELHLTLTMDTLKMHTDDYFLTGEHKGRDITSSGVADLTLRGVRIEMSAAAERFTLIPLNLLIETNSLVLDVAVESLEVSLSGAEDIGEELGANVTVMVDAIEEKLIENAEKIISGVNRAFLNL